MSEENTSIVYALRPKPHRGGGSAAGNGYLAGVGSAGTYGTDDFLRDGAKAASRKVKIV